MQARLIIETFSEDSDPIKDMGIGNPEKSILPQLIKELKKLDIEANWSKDHNMGDGFWYINVDLTDNDDDNADTSVVGLTYATDEAAKEEGEDWSGGFILTNEEGDLELTPPTHDIKPIIREILKVKYAGKKSLRDKIQKLEKLTKKLKNIYNLM